MKKHSLIVVILTAICLLTACNKKEEERDMWNSLWRYTTQTEARLTHLEEMCNELNSNVSALQTIVNALNNNVTVTNITPVLKNGEEIGYTITFSDGKIITIYHGQDGKDGQTPEVTVRINEDGTYEWVVNGETIKDANGNTLVVSGADGKDGVTPRFKIENDYWYVSYDNGATWTMLSKATGEKGDKGDKGDTGETGPAGQDVFSSVTYDENNVYFTLTDGTAITISKKDHSEVTVVDGAIMAEFSVSDSTKVYFSKGNLQYSESGTHLCADGSIQPGTWRFAEEQWINSSTDWISTFGWATSGYHDPTDTQNVYYLPTSTATGTNSSERYRNPTGYGPSASCDLVGQYAYYDWGVYNAISNGGNTPGQWRTLSYDEWVYLRNHHIIFHAKVAGKNGIVILPDNWEDETYDSYLGYIYNVGETKWSTITYNIYTEKQWQYCFEKHGALFFPNYSTATTYYWSCSVRPSDAYPYNYAEYGLAENQSDNFGLSPMRYTHVYVRLVKDVQ